MRARRRSFRGVRAREEDAGGVHITRVEILDDRGARALGKPVGRYVTLELRALSRHEAGSLETAAEAISREAAAVSCTAQKARFARDLETTRSRRMPSGRGRSETFL